MLGPKHPLPVSDDFDDSETYVEALLDYVASSNLLLTLCGGVHVLDFFTRTPDLYTQLLPETWRSFFEVHDIMDILDLLMREDLSIFDGDRLPQWREKAVPPADLLQYIRDVRKFQLKREVSTYQNPENKERPQELARKVALGMNVKKVHEVSEFSRYVNRLTADISTSQARDITHLVDFGSGQNYLGRALASEPYNKHIIAVESRPHNIEGAMYRDVKADLAPKQLVMRNKKEFRTQPKGHSETENGTQSNPSPKRDLKGERGFFAKNDAPGEPSDRASLKISVQGKGSVQYVEHYIKDGELSRVVDQIVDQDVIRERVVDDLQEANGTKDDFVDGNIALEDQVKAVDPSLMVISLHSCGNLVHHGLRSLLLNPSVSAVALIGCCYNLLTERLGPATYKLPSLRSSNLRLEKTSNSYDPHGFPMSERLCKYESRTGKGLRLNITARMMAVQAPYNWGNKDSDGFFTRHFYRALLQRVFLDCGVVKAPKQSDIDANNGSPLGWSGGTAPIILGSLRKSCYASFPAYVRGALAKLYEGDRAAFFREKTAHLTDADIQRYADEYALRKKELSVVWSLMAFSAHVIEAVIVCDRWLFLREQDEIAHAWVEPIFEYALSPRNLVVVGIKK